MNDDLISRKALFEEIQSFRCSITGLRAEKGVFTQATDEYQKSILQIVEDQPTVFDKAKILRELKAGEKVAHDDYIRQYDEFNAGMEAAYWIAIKAVEKGGAC